jgi:hypothetical protein
MAVISKGITLSYKTKGASGEFTPLTNLYEIPELGGDVDKIEVTTLASEAHEYVNGIKNYGDTIAFKFYYEKEQFATLSGLTECDWKVELPGDLSYTFSGEPSVKLDGVSYNAALTYSLNIAPTSAMVVA